MKLREYQEKAKQGLREKFFSEKKHKVITWCATGGGKGLMMSDLVNSLLASNKKVLTVMAGRDLVFQTRENYFKYHKIYSSIIMGNEAGFDQSNPCQICSIDTLRARDIDFIREFPFVIADEAHMTNAPRYQEFFSKMRPDTYFAGYTATPYNNLSFWEDYVYPISPAELRDQGFLVPIIHYAPKSQIDVSEIKTVAGEFNQKQLAGTSSKITGDIVQHWLAHGQDRPTICFAVNKEHSESIACAFRLAGVTAIHLDESSNKHERKDAISRVKQGEIKILCNVNIFSVGVDIPEISCAILARPTQSEILYVQQIGRVLRTFPGKLDSIILDHAGNIYRHGGAYDDREIRLGNKPKTETKVKVKTCKSCMAVVGQHVSFCPMCGEEFKTTPKDGICEVNGELGVVTNYHRILFFRFYEELLKKEKWMGWKPVVKFHKLYDRFGNDMFEYRKEITIPLFFEQSLINKGQLKLEF